MDADDENSGWPISSTSRPPPKVLWAEPTVSQQMDAQMDSQMDTHMVAQVEDEAYIPSGTVLPSLKSVSASAYL